MSTVTFTGHAEEHLFILFPYIQIIMGIAIVEMGKNLVNRFKTWKIVIILLILMLVTISLLEHKDLIREKVHKSTCHVSMLTSWLSKNRIYKPIVFNRSVEFKIELYSRLKIDPLSLLCQDNCSIGSIEGRDTDINFSLVFENLMSNSNSKLVYIFEFSDVDYDLKTYKFFKQLAKKLNKEIIVRKEFLYSDGRTRYLIVSLK